MNFFTELREGLAISWSAIRANKLRSVLTTLGIVIGIVTVTLMGTAIQGLNNSFMNSVSSIGADVLYVERYGWFINSHEAWMNAMKNPNITLADVAALQRQMKLASAIAPVASDSDQVKYQKRNSSSSPILGTTEDYQYTGGLVMARGHFLTSAEANGGRPVCVIGADLATNLFLNANPIGEKIMIEKHEFEVIGVLDKQGGFAEEGGADNEVILPLPQFIRHIWSNPPYSIQVKVAGLADLDDAKEELRVVLRRYRHLAPGAPDNFSINQQDQILDMFHKVAGTIAGIGLFITGLSLFVGGIGIMNIMFVSVAERTREIGVRKAIGAKNRTILLQFIIEAACICLIGGVIALLIAWPATLLLQNIMPATLSLRIMGIALLVSALTGILSGFFPAWRAARMNTVDALRNE
ncbi:MAG: ABC transporter permease [Verrucomicrobiae bacterium]|nr:ABC transporter permease [Verrucomicrobiae bacterium]